MKSSMVKAWAACAAGVGMAAAVTAQEPAPRAPEAAAARPQPAAAPAASRDAEIKSAIQRGVEALLSMQESGENGEGEKAQWPYEGVYRVGGKIPIGYRVGGTAICAIALMRAPGYAEDEARRSAVGRAAEFIAAQVKHPLMSVDDYAGGYDVRAWGYIYAVQVLSEGKMTGAFAEDRRAALDEACRWYLSALVALEMPETGGWSYSRPQGRKTVGAPSPFMTGPALQALFVAKAAGYEVDAGVVRRGLDVLEKGRAASGAINYAINPDGRRADLVPGAMGRMLATESTLLLAGRSSPAGVRAALDAFFVHWGQLEARRKKPGTHVGPYGVAPYYFMYAHEAAGRAIEQLPRGERAEYRRLLAERLFAVRDEDGTWNDRVFRRSAAYGTACAMLALLAKDNPAPAGWPGE